MSFQCEIHRGIDCREPKYYLHGAILKTGVCANTPSHFAYQSECGDHRLQERHWVSDHRCKQAGQTPPVSKTRINGPLRLDCPILCSLPGAVSAGVFQEMCRAESGLARRRSLARRRLRARPAGHRFRSFCRPLYRARSRSCPMIAAAKAGAAEAGVGAFPDSRSPSRNFSPFEPTMSSPLAAHSIGWNVVRPLPVLEQIVSPTPVAS